MRNYLGCSPRWGISRWIFATSWIVASVAGFLFVGAAHAADTVAYTFEPGLEGFTHNDSSGTTVVSQDTIGATEGTHSMKVIAGGPGFVGAQTGMLPPEFGDPPGMDHITFDITLTQPFVGNYFVIGAQIFCVTQPGPGQLAKDLQTNGPQELHFEGLPAGTYRDQKIDLSHLDHPLTGAEDVPFDDIVGKIGSGANDLIPTGWQLYFNKPIGAFFTVYIDNIRIGLTPDAVDGDYNGNGFVDAADYTVWRDHLGLTGGATPAQGDGTGDGNVTIDDYTFWKTHFGGGGGSGITIGTAAPEPSSALLLAVAAACWFGKGRNRAARLKTAF